MTDSSPPDADASTEAARDEVRLLGVPLSMGFRRVACHALRSNRLWIGAVLVALLLTMPALWVGWQADDHVHRLYFLGKAEVAIPMSGVNLFDFLHGAPKTTQALMDLGVMPWWSLPDLRLSFWRPVTSLTQLADYTFWPESAMLMHVHSLLWFGLVVALAVQVYRRLMGATWVAGLAGMLYAVDDAHGIPAGWLANRNALVAGAFSLLTLLAHDRWRRDGWRPGGFLAPVLLAFALLSAEFGAATLAYLFAYAVTIEKGDWRSRAGGLLSHAAVACAWLGMYRSRGHGTWGSGFYADPMSEPLHYLATAAERLPVLLFNQFTLSTYAPYILMRRDAQVALTLLGVAVLAVVLYAFRPLLRRNDVARFWLLGSLLCLLPVGTTMPNSRLLLLSGLGNAGLVAMFIAYLVEMPAGRPGWFRRVMNGGLCIVFLICHVVIAPLVLPMAVWGITALAEAIDRPALEAPLGDAVSEKTVVIVNPPIPFFATYLPMVRAVNGVDWPQRLRVLASGMGGVEVTRTDERSVTVSPGDGFLNGPFDTVFRGLQHPLAEGDVVEVVGMRATVMSGTDDGRPASVRFEFDRDLDDPSMVWLRWEEGRLVPHDLPAVGGSVKLEPVALPFSF